ncbi:MAG: hypothetical protein R2856_02845 [Caldilineaceae bacterium]
MQRLVWLASYPKSGNTWVRLFLTAYNHPERQEVDINAVDVSLHAGNRDLFDRVIGLEASELTPVEIERYRPDVYRQLAIEAEEPLSSKCMTAGGTMWTIPPSFPRKQRSQPFILCVIRVP